MAEDNKKQTNTGGAKKSASKSGSLSTRAGTKKPQPSAAKKSGSRAGNSSAAKTSAAKSASTKSASAKSAAKPSAGTAVSGSAGAVKPRTVETELLDATAALKIADTADDAALKKLGVALPEDGEEVAAAAQKIDPGVREAPAEYRFEPDSSPASRRAVKSDFDAPTKAQEVISPVEAYADVTAQVLSEGIAGRSAPSDGAASSEQSPASGSSGSAQPKKVVRQGKRVRRAREIQAQADYRTEGEINEAIARNEQYLRQSDARRRKSRLLALILLILFVAFLIVFGISVILNHQTGFTVNLSGTDRQKGLALFDNASMENGSSRLVTEDVPDCDNHTYSEIRDIAISEIDLGDGQQSRKYWFFAYSFYVKNEGRGTVDYQMTVDMLSASHGVDDAVRVMLIEDSDSWGAPGNRRVMTVAAKPASDPNTGEWLYGNDGKPVMQQLYDPTGKPYPAEDQDNAVAFYNKTKAVHREVKDFSNQAGSNVRKYTILVYLEGGDPDCDNNIKGGGIKFKVEFEVTGYRAGI